MKARGRRSDSGLLKEKKKRWMNNFSEDYNQTRRDERRGV